MAERRKRCWIAFLSLLAVIALIGGIGMRGADRVIAAGGELFPNGGFEGEGSNWTANGGTPVLTTEEAHTGEKSLKVTEFWARWNVRGDIDDPNEMYRQLVAGLETGTLYRITLWSKSSGEGTTTLGAGLTLTGQSGDSWAYPRLNFFGGMYCYGYDTNWVERTSVFGLTREAGTGKIVMFVDGKSEKTEITSVGNADFDLGSNNGGTWFDDISVMESTYSGDVRISLKDGANAVSGKTLIIKDAAGNPLETQPQIVEAEGVYTVKGLTFNTLKDSYRFSVEGVTGIADGVITALESSYEMGISEYSATVRVEETDGTAISDAEVTATVGGERIQVTNNGDGTYTICNLFSAVDVVVEKEGLIGKSIRLTAEEPQKTVVLTEEKPATEVVGNLIVNGNFEDVLKSGTQEPGKWNAESGSLAKTTNNQEDGKYSLEIVGRSAYRIDLGSIRTDGTKYILSFAAMAEGTGSISVGMRPTVSSNGGYAYPETMLVAGETLGQMFAVIKVDFSIEFDEIAKTVRYTVNGQESEVYNEIASFAAIDFVFYAENGVYLDNVCCLTAYDIEFIVRDGGTEVTEGLTFEVLGYDGKAWDVEPVYTDGAWRIGNACGTVQIIVKQGDKTYPLAAFDSRNTSATIENGFRLTVTLTDGEGNPVRGATVVARRGASDLFTMQDNGDGTYTYDEANGTFNLYVTLEGYVFPVERNVSAEKTEITIQATASPEAGESASEKTNGGCGSLLDGSLGLACAAFAAFFACRKKRGE